MSVVSKPRDYQLEGITWLCRQLLEHKAVLLADDAGLGKTLQALSAAQQLKADRVLIICPAGARRVWVNEIYRWFPAWDSRVVLIEPGRTLSPNEEYRFPSNGAVAIVIVSYDELSNLKSPITRKLRLVHWDLLILDEAHYLKNPSNRTKVIYGSRSIGDGLQAHAEKVILLTGTPTPNHAGELWQHYRTFWPKALGTEKPLRLDQFEEKFTRYRDTVYGRQVVGSKNQAALRQLLAPMILRRRKAEVLTELPPLILQDIPLVSNPHGPAIKPPTALDGWGVYSDDELLRRLNTFDGALATARRELGEAKVQPAILWIQERMASTDKLLIFAWHHSVIAHVARGLAEFSPVVVTGDTSPANRASLIHRFQNDPHTRLFIGQILAAGTAITLTAASEVAIVEPSWVPGQNYQAICRAHRLGQRDSVLASFLFLPDTLDERIMATFRRKAAEISELQGDPDAQNHAYLRHRQGHNQQDLRHARQTIRGSG